MALQFDQLNNQLKTNDSTNANASMVLTPSGTGAVLLNGTGQNLSSNSQTLASFGQTNTTTTNNAAVAPDNTSTASSVVPTTSSAIHRLYNTGSAINVINGITYTSSVYAKANGYRYLYLNQSSAFNAGATFDLQAGTVLNGASGTSSIVSVGNGWYRCIITGTATSSQSASLYWSINNAYVVSDTTFAGDGTSGLYMWGVQVELGSVANTYVPTTTTAIYNAPVLSFSGVAGLGLQSDGSLYVQPAGTGALQAQPTTSSTVGGNARGANAADFQTLRGAAYQVASGAYSFLGAGQSNSSRAYASVIGGGVGNDANNTDTFVGGGGGNTASGYISAIVGGGNNSALGYYNFIGAGSLNSATSGSAVTTQSGTMNGTTAVTLSGSNASIKVGQYITGTSIAGDTYVAAISGTSLTLSKNASGSSTSTLSFYTPHGVVVGGGNNQATGSYSFIGGGGDAGTAANRNTASGDWSVCVGGSNNQATGLYSYIVGGFASIASGQYSSIAGGAQHTASNSYATVCGGQSSTASGVQSAVLGGFINVASGSNSVVMGGQYGTSRSINGYTVFTGNNSAVAGAAGNAQAGLLVLGRQTTDATPTVLTSNNNSAGGTNQVILPNNSAYYVRGSIVAGVTGAGNSSSWTFQGTIKRGANAAATSIVGAGITASLVSQDAGAATWAVAITADTTNGGLAVTVTGAAATTIRWVCQIETTEMTF
jgi:hypothetical protein